MRLRVLVPLVALVAAASCRTAAAPQPRQRSTITGVVVDVDSPKLGDVRSFSVRSGGKTYKIFVDPEVRYAFALPHLSEHLATAEPVRVEVDERGGKLYATAIEDA